MTGLLAIIALIGFFVAIPFVSQYAWQRAAS